MKTEGAASLTAQLEAKKAFNEIEVMNNAHNASAIGLTAAKKKALGNTVIKII